MSNKCSGTGCGKHVAHCKGCGKGATEMEYLSGWTCYKGGSYCVECKYKNPEVVKHGRAANA